MGNIKQRGKELKKTEDIVAKYIALCMSLGLCLGAAFGVLFNNIALGIPIGMCFGMCIGIAIGSYRKDQNTKLKNISKKEQISSEN
jgi:F0F1-type ATP synthase assembly protein I